MKLCSFDFRNEVSLSYSDLKIKNKHEYIIWLKEFRNNDAFSFYQRRYFENRSMSFRSKEHYGFEPYQRVQANRTKYLKV